MIHQRYDVIVLGRSIGALTAAALLARRDFTVMVVGQGERPPTYQLDQGLARCTRWRGRRGSPRLG